MSTWTSIIGTLDQIGIIVGLIISIPIFWTWWVVTFGEKRKQKKLIDAIRNSPGNRPGILIIDLLIEKDALMAIENYQATQEALKDIPPERIQTVSRSQGIAPANMPGLIEDIRRAHKGLTNAGVDKIHYFHAGMSGVAALVGAELGNSAPVTLYQYTNGCYNNFGPLRLPIIV